PSMPSAASTAHGRVSPYAPTVSKLGASGTTPSRGVIPVVGLNAKAPQYAAGRHTEAAVCVPSATGTTPAPTAAAEPLLEPPGVWDAWNGLTVAGASR